MCYSIEEIREKTIPIARTYGISKVGLFGSYARSEANDNSDIDLYIDKGKLKSLIQYFSFINELEGKLGYHVDAVTTGIEDKAFLNTITSSKKWTKIKKIACGEQTEAQMKELESWKEKLCSEFSA